MTKYTVHYEVNKHVYETDIYTSSSAGALHWVYTVFPDAINVYIV